MKTLLTLFVLLFSSSVFADDIKDYRIEGFSIGDNLLDFFSEDFVIKNTDENAYDYLDEPNRYYSFFIFDYKESKNYELDKYDTVTIFYKKQNNSYVNKKNQDDYIIYGIGGKIIYEEKSNTCITQRDNIVNELSKIFNDVTKTEPYISSHIYDKTGNSTVNDVSFWFKNDDVVMAACYNWVKPINYFDNLKIQFLTDDLNMWLIGN